MSSIPLLVLALICGPLMVVEGVQILALGRAIEPMPKRILKWVGMLVLGKKSSSQAIAEPVSLQGLKTYGYAALVFGTLVILSAAVNLFYLLK